MSDREQASDTESESTMIASRHSTPRFTPRLAPFLPITGKNGTKTVKM